MAKTKDRSRFGQGSSGSVASIDNGSQAIVKELPGPGKRRSTQQGNAPETAPTKKRSQENSNSSFQGLDAEVPRRERKVAKSAFGETGDDTSCSRLAGQCNSGTIHDKGDLSLHAAFKKRRRSKPAAERDTASHGTPSTPANHEGCVAHDSQHVIESAEKRLGTAADRPADLAAASLSPRKSTGVKERRPRVLASAQEGATGVMSGAQTAEHELFSSSESEGEPNSQGGPGSRHIDRIAINRAYAEAYEVRKRREFLQKNKDLLLEESDESRSSSEEEDDDAVMLSDRVECKILDTLARIKNKDPSVYDTNHRFFHDDDFEDTVAAETRTEKGTRYSDVVRETLSKRGPTAFLEEEDALARRRQQTDVPGYNGELSALKKAFLDAAEGTDEDGDADGLLESKQKTEAELADEETEYQIFLKSKAGKQQVDHNATLSRYWAPDESLDPDERFLRDYILHQGWREDRVGAAMDYHKLQKLDEEDELNMDQTEAFEAAYNFRFEEEGGLEIQGHARRVEGSVRQKNDKRRRQREAKKARLAEEKALREKELKRLKALKKKEIVERIQKIQEITGHTDLDVSAIDFEADFDPEAHDKEMVRMLGDDYDDYAETADPEHLLRVPPGFEDALGAPPAEFASAGKQSKKQRRLEKMLQKREGRPVMDEEAYAPLPEGEEHTVPASAHENSVRPPDDPEAGDGAVGEWWLCDGCGSSIPGGKKRFDCTTCENYTLCKQCFRCVRHPHQLVKKTVPRHCKPPTGYQDGLEKLSCLENYLDECLQPDYEDIIGKDLPTRFKYKTVTPNNYGMSVEEILSRTDKELNAIVSLKKLAPYRESGTDSRKKLRRAQFRRMHPHKSYQTKVQDLKENSDSRVTEFGITQARLRAYDD
ncbi:zinc zz type domain-containing protein [Cystoisospora suis]|uniref:Zinc zz type domain-containing protein n=1 Tax=Cystoisospora suis TaxID=483139 RepID=A0A2C6KZE2_9APIC|nr:zinc zz type domain-containing protein [Cystoisospora suis]